MTTEKSESVGVDHESSRASTEASASGPMTGATDLTRAELEALLSIIIASIALPRDGWRRRDAGRAVAAIQRWSRELSDWCYYVPERDGRRT